MTEWPEHRLTAHGLASAERALAFADTLADIARALIAPHIRRPVSVAYKSDATPVTAVDREVERALRDAIAAEFPSHGIIGEEYGADLGDAGERGEVAWIIDPIDGTKAFVTGRPSFGTLIGLLVDGVPVLGVLDVPALGDRWIGAVGQPTRVNGAPTKTSDVTTLSDARLASTTIDMFEGADLTRFNTLGRELAFRVFGGDCHSYGLLASGFLELVVEGDLESYDYLPLVPIIQGAGGLMTDWKGETLSLQAAQSQVLVAANGELHSAASRILSGTTA